MTDEMTPRERIAAGYAASTEAHAKAALERTAAQHRPEFDAEADRIAGLPERGVPLSPTTRMQIGLHDRARQAACKINTTTEETTP